MIQLVDGKRNTRTAHSDVLGPKCLKSPAGGRYFPSFFFFFSVLRNSQVIVTSKVLFTEQGLSVTCHYFSSVLLLYWA